MTRLYANENFPLPVVEELRRLGHEVLTTYEAGDAGKSVPDERVLAFATAEGRAFVTINRKHFIHLHNANPDHAGIIRLQLRFRLHWTGQQNPHGHRFEDTAFGRAHPH
jgi:hypothetical protein